MALLGFHDAQQWARDAEAGDRFCTFAEAYEDEAAERRNDGDRCGYGDDELDQISKILGRRGLKLATDDIGLIVETGSRD